MKYNRLFFLNLTAALLIAACSSDEPTPSPGPVTVTYEESAEDFANPERGFYHYSETRASSYTSLSETQLRTRRSAHRSSGATYDIVSSLVFRYYVLDDFKNSTISETFLNSVRADMMVARAAGVKLIPRFTYTISVTEGECPESFICPPYGDASKEIVLQHIAQLKPILTDNADVILALQAGFIGTWGEQYYTDHFGDASSNGQSKLLDENWQDRIDVIKALLDAVPEHIMVQVRYPQLKQRVVYGINATVSSLPLQETEAFTDAEKARLGFHNDCFLASADDFGTYEDYGNSSSPRTSANTTLRKYFADDSRYVVVGGETCSDGYSPQNDCAPTGKADLEMANLHYTYLNADYNHQVNNDWVEGGCIESIKRNLGYRIVLKNGVFPSVVEQGDLIDIQISLSNVGYASPVKSRPVRLILREKETGAWYGLDFATDVRRWFTGDHQLSESFPSSGISPGEYDLLLNLPDAAETISERAEYSIRCANSGVWEETSGFNSLNHVLRIK